MLDSTVTPEESADGHDYRSDLAWIFDNDYDWVIADVPDVIAAQLAAEGRRNLNYLITDGHQVVDGTETRGWYRRSAKRSQKARAVLED